MIAATPRSTAWVQMAHGACVDLLTPDLAGISINDIAAALSRLPRWCGHTQGAYAYSVAQHSLHVMELVRAQRAPDCLVRAALLHDAAEAFTGDVPTPVKRLLGEGMRAIEARLAAAVARRFAPGAALDNTLIRHCDKIALATERRDLLAPAAWPWGEDLPRPDRQMVVPVAASAAYAQFVGAAGRLGLS